MKSGTFNRVLSLAQQTLSQQIDKRLPEKLNLKRFAHPMAEKVAWAPLKPGGTNVRAEKAVQISAMEVIIKSTFTVKAIALLVFLLGLSMLFLGVADMINPSQGILEFHGGFLMLISLLPLWAGNHLIKKVAKRSNFQRENSSFFQEKPERAFSIQKIKSSEVSLDNIVAIQLLREYIRSSEGKHFDSYEMNLVLDDGSRVNLMDHGDLRSIRSDAKMIARFLSVPVWDGIRRGKK
ncbi:MAG: hypothetical protein AAFY71_26920 [Bacteroidota bacterium]